MLARHSVELTHNLLWNICPQVSWLAEPLWIDHDQKKKKKKEKRKWNCRVQADIH